MSTKTPGKSVLPIYTMVAVKCGASKKRIMFSHYHVQGALVLGRDTSHDLISGRLSCRIGLDNEIRGYQYNWDYTSVTEREYTPAALRRSGTR